LRAILFDIDGTLALSGEADGECFAEAFMNVFGLDRPSIVWSDYRHVTDWGILDQALGGMRGRGSTHAERAAFDQAYRNAWDQRIEQRAATCNEVPGAANLVAEILERGEFLCGVATGNSRAVGRLKIELVGIDSAPLPGGFGNDAVTRSAITCLAARAVGAPVTETVYIGDGAWDAITCARLGMRFVGVSAESGAQTLYNAGASQVIENFSDRDAFWNAIERATVPTLS